MLYQERGLKRQERNIPIINCYQHDIHLLQPRYYFKHSMGMTHTIFTTLQGHYIHLTNEEVRCVEGKQLPKVTQAIKVYYRARNQNQKIWPQTQQDLALWISYYLQIQVFGPAKLRFNTVTWLNSLMLPYEALSTPSILVTCPY